MNEPSPSPAEVFFAPLTPRTLFAAVALHAILTTRDTSEESHANIARDALGLADALIAQAQS
jgi:hypothetical protein